MPAPLFILNPEIYFTALTKTYKTASKLLQIIFILTTRTAKKSGSYIFMKNLFLLSVAGCIASLSFAQTKFQSQMQSPAAINFGVKAGVSSSGIRGEAANNFNNLVDFAGGTLTTKNVTGFFAGGFLSIPVTDGLSLEPGLYYSEKGYEMTGQLNTKKLGFLSAGGTAKLGLDYIDVPVLLKVGVSGLQFFAGPQFSYLSKANLHSTAGLLGINLLSNDMDVTSSFNRWDVGVTGGVGYTFGKGLTLSASYDYGMSKLDKNQNSNAYNQSFKVGLSVGL